MPKFLGVSHSRYRAFLNHKVSLTRQRKAIIKSKSNISMTILTLTMVLLKSPKNSAKPENVLRSVPLENICVRWESKLNGLNPELLPPAVPISAKNFITYLMSSLIPFTLTLYGVRISPTSRQLTASHTLIALWTCILVK